MTICQTWQPLPSEVFLSRTPFTLFPLLCFDLFTMIYYADIQTAKKRVVAAAVVVVVVLVVVVVVVVVVVAVVVVVIVVVVAVIEKPLRYSKYLQHVIYLSAMFTNKTTGTES
ncbi:hypothetical protein ElyMa_003736900 [Elysia marginata]|uniref:G-protein coupled receptors family 1 profile domain-containing protein n=1 Tax=Elysia marginata TaxID=1093978 RepID=A0AAV4F5Z7_9GAST|nr:hypothetical protein ElyMa_003736900 [Elysia marginata]